MQNTCLRKNCCLCKTFFHNTCYYNYNNIIKNSVKEFEKTTVKSLEWNKSSANKLWAFFRFLINLS